MEQTLQEQINSWKKEFGEIQLTEINGIEFIFRLITYKEYETIHRLSIDDVELDERICELCVLSPVPEEGWGGEVFAGYSSSIGAIIREESLISAKASGESIQDIIEKGAIQMENNFQMQLPAIIARVFPQYKIDEIEEMTLKKQVDIYIKAQWVLKEIDGKELGFDSED